MEFLEQYAEPAGSGARGRWRSISAPWSLPAPWEVLAITFTNKAANELKEPAGAAMLGEAARGRLGLHLPLRLRAASCAGTSTSIGFDRSFTIYDTDDSKRVIKDILKELNLDEKTFPPRSVLSVICQRQGRARRARRSSRPAWRRSGDWRMSAHRPRSTPRYQQAPAAGQRPGL